MTDQIKKLKENDLGFYALPKEDQELIRVLINKNPENIVNKCERGYDAWDPFQEPKDPIDIRMEKTQRTTQMLVREFLQTQNRENYSNEYGRGVLDICLGIVNDDERSRGMFEFSLWYHELLKKEGIVE